MKKYKLSRLDVEITRKCNRRCAHCMRGEAQDLTITEKVIDCIFEGVADVQCVVLTGGEPLLEIEKMIYFIKRLMKSKWSTKCIEFTTNGTVLDERIIEALERFCSSRKYRSAIIRISNDPFHIKEDYEAAYSFYASLITDANNRIRRKNNSIGIGLTYTSTRKKAALMYTLDYAGRATELIDSQYQKITYPFLIDARTDGSEMKHRVKVLGDVVPCAFSVLANGNLSFSESTTFDKSDELSIGKYYGTRYF